MRILVSESTFNKIEKDFDESIRFDQQRSTYKWINDKKDIGVDTSLTQTNDGKITYRYMEQLLPHSQVISLNLYNIKNFNVTQALKHNISYFVSTPGPTELTPDKSIGDFKYYVAKHIVRLLGHKQIDPDVILTPQSSSQFNVDMSNIISQQYEKYHGKKLQIIPNAFIKTPENAKIDIEHGKEYLKRDLQNLYTTDTEKDIDEKLKSAVNKVYELVRIWQIEGKIGSYVKKVYELRKLQKYIGANRPEEKIPPCKQKKINEIQLAINDVVKLLETNVGMEDLKKAKQYYTHGTIRQTPKPFQIKGLPDGVRQSIYNLFSLSNKPDTCYSYKQKSGEEVSGVSKLIDQLKRNNKTIMIFDDNLSSGRTMDDAAYHLITQGINKENIVVVTLGIVKPSIYSKYSQFYRGLS